jgi:hypothetical protein
MKLSRHETFMMKVTISYQLELVIIGSGCGRRLGLVFMAFEWIKTSV